MLERGEICIADGDLAKFAKLVQIKMCFAIFGGPN